MRALAAIAVALLVAVAPATAATPSDLSRDPLDRGTLLALPSIYRVTVTIDVPALVTSDGERLTLSDEARVIVESGTAFGVAPGGWLATARHVVAPDDPGLARLAYRSRLAYAGEAHDDATVDAWLERTQAKPQGARVTKIVVTQADTGDGARMSMTWMPVRVVPSSTADLALVHIPAPGAPALALDEALSLGTPVVTVGFGRGSALAGDDDGLGELEPAIRRGRLGRTGTLEGETPPRQAIVIDVPVQGGDSGAPVVDRDGAVHGVVIQQARDDAGLAETATELRELMTAARLEPRPGISAGHFRDGMEALWALDPAAAETSFEAALDAFPPHTLAGRERLRAQALAAGGLSLSGDRRPQGLLLGLGMIAAVIALGFGVALVGSLPRRGPSPRGR